MVLFVDINDVCRSVVAAACYERAHARKAAHAGVYTVPGTAPNPQAVTAAKELGCSLDESGARQLSRDMLSHAERVYGITASVSWHLQQDYPQFARKIRALPDVKDPFGMGPTAYLDCVRTLRSKVEALDAY